jgi:hypothetical protein
MQLRALRDEMQALLNLLGASRPTAAVPAVAEVRPMRPRLVLEARPPILKPEPVRVETLRLVRDPDPQGDLFPGA